MVVRRRPGARVPYVWGATGEEVAATYACDEIAPAHRLRLLRAVDVPAPPQVVFAWLGNLRLAPYSYDLIDNLGRRSPRRLRTDLPPLAAGQRVMGMFTAAVVEPDRRLVVRTHPGPASRIFGDVLMEYSVEPGATPGATRLVGIVRASTSPSVIGRIWGWLLAWGDLVMMRKQLRTLGRLAEASRP